MVGSRIFIKSDTTKEDGISSPSTVHVLCGDRVTFR